MRLLIVDDEFHSRRIIRKFIEDGFNEFVSISEASSFNEAIDILSKESFDLLILDIFLDVETGFEILKKNDIKKSEIIFITGHDNYALEAYKVGAINYLLKPIEKEKVVTAVQKVITLMNGKSNESIIKSNSFLIRKISIPYNGSTRLIDISKLMYVRADSSYCTLELIGNESLVISKPLRFIENKMNNYHFFFRLHKTYLINLNFVTELSNDSQFVKMMNDKLLPVSRFKKNDLKNLLSNSFFK